MHFLMPQLPFVSNGADVVPALQGCEGQVSYYMWSAYNSTRHSLVLSPSVESCGCGLGPSPVRLGDCVTELN